MTRKTMVGKRKSQNRTEILFLRGREESMNVQRVSMREIKSKQQPHSWNFFFCLFFVQNLLSMKKELQETKYKGLITITMLCYRINILY